MSGSRPRLDDLAGCAMIVCDWYSLDDCEEEDGMRQGKLLQPSWRPYRLAGVRRPSDFPFMSCVVCDVR